MEIERLGEELKIRLNREERHVENAKDEIKRIIRQKENISESQADTLVTSLIENDLLDLNPDDTDTTRALFIKSGIHEKEAVSYKLHNISFNFKKAALSFGIDAFDAGLGIESIATSRNPQLYLLLLLLKVIAGIRVELTVFDAELAAFLWKERVHRRLYVEETYDAFVHYLAQQNQRPVEAEEYQKALDRLEQLHVIEMEDGAIRLREKMIVK